MKKINILIALILLLTLSSNAQSITRYVIGSSGGTLTDGSSISVDFTIGEIAVTTISNGQNTLSNGFHQGELKLSIKLYAKTYLQGAFLNPNIGEEDLMRDDLRLAGYLSITSPYSDALETVASVFDVTGTDAIVDWVWIELRDKNDISTVVSSQSGLLQRDGDIVGVDGVSPLSFNQEEGDYYIAISHRNHLKIATSIVYNLSSTNTLIDLTKDSSNITGGLNAIIVMGNSIYAIPSGDYDSNGQIQISDISSVIQILGGSGYRNADMDMNGQVQNSDINNIINTNIGKGQQF